jgi:hypothetical protein
MPSGGSKKTEGLESNGTHQLLIYADNNIGGKTTSTINKIAEALLNASKETGLEENLVW